VVPLPQVNLGEDGAARRLGAEIQHVGKRVYVVMSKTEGETFRYRFENETKTF
jgi:hypothetical protein